MHKGVILLVKASDRDEAKEKAEEFLEPYGDGDVWDWYSIGNRWHNTLAPADKVKKFHKSVTKLYPQLKGSYSINDIENDKVRPIIQKEWDKLGLKGKNPFWSNYGFDVKDTPDDYNIVPLSECIETVKKWVKDTKKEAKEYYQKMQKERVKENKSGKGTMSEYYAGLYKDAIYNNFCFESNVYDTETQEGESIPKDITGYWAVMIDMHN